MVRKWYNWDHVLGQVIEIIACPIFIYTQLVVNQIDKIVN
jgi:hypothetical protein